LVLFLHPWSTLAWDSGRSCIMHGWRASWPPRLQHRWSEYSTALSPRGFRDQALETGIRDAIHGRWRQLVANFDGRGRTVENARGWIERDGPMVAELRTALAAVYIAKADTTFGDEALAEVDAAVAILDSVAASVIAAG
jgi:hypothetical protein